MGTPKWRNGWRGPSHVSADTRMPDRGLRVRKKEEQQVRLLDAAMILFRQKGYDGTRVEDIAMLADVSTKTVYNYFPIKLDILIELLNRDRRRLTASYERVVNNPPSDPAEGFARLMHADIGDDFSSDDKQLWLELIAASFRASEGAWTKIEVNRRMFTKYVRRLLVHYVSSGALSERLSPSVVVEIIYSVHARNFREFCAIAAYSATDILRLNRRQMRHLLADWRS
jgi:AcrR family transcriptional regulator